MSDIINSAITNDITELEDGGADSGHVSPFDNIRLMNSDGIEYWSARDLAKILGYAKWEKFRNAIERAEVACENSGQSVEDHFSHTVKISTFGKGGKREIEDVHMSRYGCYLLVQNADPGKPAVAIGQTYFAIQTRRQEEADELAGLTEEQRRLYLPSEMSRYNRRLAEAANLAGVIEPVDFAVFTDHGYQGLYGGLKSREIHRRKGLKKTQHILDHMGGTELAANLFRVTQTEDKLRREDIKGKKQANQTHYSVGQEVRDTIKRLGGTLPEELPTPQESIQQLQRKEAKQLKQGPQLPLLPSLLEGEGSEGSDV